MSVSITLADASAVFPPAAMPTSVGDMTSIDRTLTRAVTQVPKLIRPPTDATPTEAAAAGGRRRALPDDLLREASARLGIMSLVAASLWVVGTILGRLAMRSMQSDESIGLGLTMDDAIAAVSVLASLLLFAYTRTANQDPQRILNLGLAYMVLTALALGLTFHSGPIRPTRSVSPQISWIGALILMFSATIPSTRTKTLLAGVVAASMNPVGMLWARAQGYWDFGPASNALLMHYPDYLLVGVAVVISHVVTTLGREVTKAREMGSYRLGELLGRGGMGEVYKASHRMLARPAAIKLIRPEMLGCADRDVATRAIARFRREAEAAAQLRSPHTVDLYDFGVTDDQTLYLVMEFLDGMDLESLVRQHGPMPAPRVVHVLRQVCDSLEEAHARGLVHRDIKPANIHLGRVGVREDFVKVLDFGLVKTAAAGVAQSLPTIEGVIMGTPAYMAPEMALGDSVDGRADLYALGCVAYYLLTGAQVFTGDTVLKVITQHLQAVPVPPSGRTELPIPQTLEHLVLACLAKKPEERPQNARQLAQLLDTIDGMTWGEEDAIRWWSQHHSRRPSTSDAITL
jgi:serine/threonine-protein kinase